MDATLKRRIWKVAAIHFLLSVYAAYVTFNHVVMAHGSFGLTEIWRTLEPHFAGRYAWGSFWVGAFCLLQPHFFFEYQLEQMFPFSNILNSASKLPNWLTAAVLILSIPICSFCSSWLIVKLDNWLNHFPVLGKRVF